MIFFAQRLSPGSKLVFSIFQNIENLVKDNSFARTSITAFIDYNNGLESDKTNVLCSDDCLRGVFIGNLDVRHANPKNGTFKLTIVAHGFMNDQFKIDLVSLVDLVLASKIKEENKGTSKCRHYENKLS